MASVVEPVDWDYLDSILPVSRETKRHLEEYVSLVLHWQSKTNLISGNTVSAIWKRHIADSLQCLSLIGNDLVNVRQWLDLGSGGGFPGIVIAIVLSEHGVSDGEISVHLVESIAKKCAFLRQANRKCNGCAEIHNTRIEELEGIIPVPEVITARALAHLKQLLDWIYPLGNENTRIMLYKGREYRSELEECRGLWHFNLVEHQSRVEPDSVILEITGLKKA